ncbi:MAG: zinc finger domain-containing protein, partial [Rubrobacter sp.]
LKVFARAGEPCPSCGKEIVKSRVAGRGTHVCTSCQM